MLRVTFVAAIQVVVRIVDDNTETTMAFEERIHIIDVLLR